MSEVIPSGVALSELAELEERARSFARDSRALSTWRAYESDFAHFRGWCASFDPAAEALPATAAVVALYLSNLAETSAWSARSAARRTASTPTSTCFRLCWAWLWSRLSTRSGSVSE